MSNQSGIGATIEAMKKPQATMSTTEDPVTTTNATNDSSPTKKSDSLPSTADEKGDNNESGGSTDASSSPVKKLKTSSAQGTDIPSDAAKRKEILASYKAALVRREEACRELLSLENEAAASNIPLFEDYAKDPVVLTSFAPSGLADAAGISGAQTSATPLGLNGDVRKLEQFFLSTNPAVSTAPVAQVVQQAAQGPTFLQQMQLLQDQQQLQQHYAAQSFAAQQQQAAAVQQLHQHHAGLYQATAAQSVYGTPTPMAGASPAQTSDPSLLLLAAQYQQNSNPAVAPGVGSMYMSPATAYAPALPTTPGASTSLPLPGVAPPLAAPAPSANDGTARTSTESATTADV